MPIITRLFTVGDLENFPDDGSRYEVIDGELYTSTAPHIEHQLILTNCTVPLYSWSQRTRLGIVVSGGGLIFSRHDGVIPDLMWFSKERFPAAKINPASGEYDGKVYLAPEIAVEILSPGKANEERDRETKLTLYSRRGVREYWIVDRFTGTVAIYRRTAAAELALVATLIDQDTLTSPLLPGFALPIADIILLP